LQKIVQSKNKAALVGVLGAHFSGGTPLKLIWEQQSYTHGQEALVLPLLELNISISH